MSFLVRPLRGVCLFLAFFALTSFIARAQTPAATTTTVVASTSTPVAGARVQLTVTVTSGGSPVTRGRVALCLFYTYTCSPSEAFAVLQLSPSGTASTYFYGTGSQYVQAGFEGTKAYATSVSDVSNELNVLFPVQNLATTTTLTASGLAGNYTLTGKVRSYGTPTTSPMFASAPLQIVDTSNNNLSLGTPTISGQPSGISMVVAAAPTAGTQPGYVAAGDFDQDGRTDLAVVNTGDNTVSILLGNGEGTFQAQVRYATGTGPGPIVVADFDGDGFPDLAVLNKNDKSIGVLRNNGNGTFHAQVPYSTGNNPIALTSGDVDQDGLQDLVVVNHDDLTVGVLLNHGDGTFAAQVTYSTGNDPRAVAVGDANHDRVTDIAVANFADNTLSLFYGAGDGSMQPAVTMATGHGPVAVALADISDSGYTSIAYLNATDGTVTVIPVGYGGAAGPTATYTTGANPTAFAFSFLFYRSYSPDMAVLNGDGSISAFVTTDNLDGTLATTPTVYTGGAAGAVSFVSGDFNGDAVNDLAVAGTATDGLSVQTQQSYNETDYQLTGVSLAGNSTSNVVATYPGQSPSFQASTSNTLTLADSLIVTKSSMTVSPNRPSVPNTVATLTATLSPLTLGNYSAGGAYTFSDNGTPICTAVALSGGTATCATPPLATAHHIFTAAYSGDIYFASSSAERQLIVADIATTTLSLSAASAPVGTPVTASIAVQDSNGNPVNGGVVNLCEVTVSHCTGRALLGTAQLKGASSGAPGTATVPMLLVAGTHNIQAVSVTNTNAGTAGTSSTQVLTVFPTNTTTTTLASSGSTGNLTLTATVNSSPANPASSGTTVTITDSTNAFFSKTATLGTSAFNASFNAAVRYTGNKSDSFSGVERGIALASLRGNGVMDMLDVDNTFEFLEVRLGVVGTNGSGTGAFGAKVQYVVPEVTPGALNCPAGLATGDFNEDGKLDVVLGDACGNMLYVYFGHGDGTLSTAPDLSYSVSATYSIAVGDFNADGHLDIANGSEDGKVAILMNNGDGTFQAPVTSGNGSGNYATDLTAVDMDGDGALDLVFTGVFGGDVFVMLGNGDGTFQPVIDNSNTNNSFGEGNGLAVTDVNNDGIPDAILADGAEICVMLGIGDGTFHDAATYTSGNNFFTWGVAMGDFNGDGVPDVVVTNGDTSGSVGIYTGVATVQNNGDGSITYLPTGTFNAFKKIVNVGGEDLYVKAGDVNGDGITDIMVYSQDDDANFILTGAGGFTATAKATGVSIPGSATSSAHSLVASYPGDANHDASTSAVIHAAGTIIPTTTALSVSPASGSPYGQVTLTATITPSITASYVLSGNIAFKDGSTTVGTVASSGGSATYRYSPAVGTHSFTAVYAGDSNYKTSTSSARSDSVVKATPSITWNPASAKIYIGSQIGATVLNASGSIAGSFSYTATLQPSGSAASVTATTVLGLGTYTLTANFTPTDTTNYNTASGTKTFTVAQLSMWVLNADGSSLGLDESGSQIGGSTISGGGAGLAIDAGGNLWSANAAGNTLAEIAASGAVLHGGLSGGGLNAPADLAVDGDGKIWIANGNGSVSVFTNSGAAVTPSTGYTGGGSMNAPKGIAIDSSGNVWIVNSGSSAVTEIIGGAAPVVDPLATAVGSSTVGTRP